MHEQRAAFRDGRLAAREPERVLDRRGRARERVAAAGDAPQRDAAGREAAVGRERDPVRAQPAEVLRDGKDRRPEPARQLGTELERDVVALELDVAACTPRHRGRPAGRPDPERRAERPGHQPDRGWVKHSRPQQPRGRVQDAPERERQAAAACHTGTGVRASASWTASSAVTPAERCSGATIRRCVSAGTASALTSSGWT